MTDSRRTGLMLALATAGISGVSVFLNSYGVRAFGDPTTYTTAKNLVAVFVLTGMVLAAPVTGAQLTRPATLRHWIGLGVVGVVGGAVPFVLFFDGLARASSVQAAFLHKTMLIWVALLAAVVLRERMSPAHWVAVALLLLGQAGLAGGVPTKWGSGEVLILSATLLWSAEVIVAKRLLAHLSSWTVALARMGLGSALLVGWLVVRGQVGAIAALTGREWLWAGLTGVLLAGYVATWFAALTRAGAVDVTAVLVLGAIVTAALAGMVKGSSLVPQSGWLATLMVGGFLIGRKAWSAPARAGNSAGAPSAP